MSFEVRTIRRGFPPGGLAYDAPPGPYAHSLDLDAGFAYWVVVVPNEVGSDWSIQRRPLEGRGCESIFFDDVEVNTLDVDGEQLLYGSDDEVRRLARWSFEPAPC